MLNAEIKLSDKIFTSEIELAPTRDGYGKGLVERIVDSGDLVYYDNIHT